MASPGSEYNFSCQKCPRTFKLQEFYEKHQKVHLLKKQHVCAVCGFVYGAAKGLEGHMESAHSGDSEIDTNTHTNTPPVVRPKTMPTSPVDLSQQIPEMPFFHFLQAQGVLTSADLIKQAQQAMLAQMTSNARAGLNGLSLVPITISAPTSPSPNSCNVPHKLQPNDKSKIPSPAGTGNYKIYDQVPEIQDASDAQQNDSGFFRCTICTREFSGLNSLKKHVPIHTRRVQHKCDTCGYVFGKKEYLLDHMRKHTGEISPVCEVCGQTFNKSLKLKEHLKLHRNTGNDGNLNEYVPYKCHICKQCFSQPEPLGEHLRNAHSETVYKCDMCDATFGDVRGKNHHMYNEHQLDAFHQKCVWCPVCNQGFTRHYNLKVHMYKSHGKEYLENNFSQEELDSLMRPPPGSNTSKPSPSPRKRSNEEIVIPGTPTGVLPISPPLTPKLSPKQQKAKSEDSPTMVPSNSCIPSASILKANLQKTRPGPASLTKPQHYFDQEAQHAMLKCQLCEEKFLRKSDLFIHLKQHGVRVISCQHCEDKFLEVTDLKRHLTSVHGQAADHMKDSQPPQQETQPTRRPGPASRTNAPKENRATPMTSSNLPSHLAAQYQDSPGFPCQQCGKVLMHKQSYVSHMRVIHGDYYGGNKWKGSSVVEMVLGGQQGKMSDENQETLRAQLKEAINNVSRTSPTNNDSHNYNDYKFGLACEFCNKAFTDQAQLDEHIHSKHPNLTKRIQAFKAALGLNDSDEPDTKRIKLDYKGIFKDQNENSLSSYSILSFSDAHAHLSSDGYDEPLDLACKPVSVNVDEDDEVDRIVHDPNNNQNSNNLLQIARPQRASPPCSPLNLHISRPATPSPTPSPPMPSQPQPVAQAPAQIAQAPAPIAQSSSQVLPPPTNSLPQPQPQENPQNTFGAGNTDQITTPQPKLHEYLVKQSNATSDENGRKKFLCPVCKCQLSWKTNLSVHLRTHSGERPFQCVLCLNRFRQKAHLYKHFRCSHGHKVAPYKCMFCTESFIRSPNDLYNHITEVHKRETDELTNNNNNNSNNNNNNIKNEKEEILQEEHTEHQSKEDEINVDVCEENQSEAHQVIREDDVEELEVEDEESEDEFPIKDRDDDTRYEAIEEEFEFSGEYIKPCYCVLPFVSDEEVESMTKRNIAEYYEQPEEYSEDEEGQMVIDENPPTPENLSFDSRHTPSPASNNNNNFNNNELKINSFGQGFADAINICRKETQIAEAHAQPQPQPTHTVKFEPQQPALYYPAFPDFSLPFSLSGLIQKKKAEMAAILAPRLSPKEEHSKLTLDHLAKAALVSKAPLSPAKTDSANNNTAVSEYENQIQNDLWPLDCIKCHSVLTNLDNFNIHMNDHWSDDKCCPVCGLLINSKRFNFKQHLKIHTGEKPFVCQVCNRAFRQKAHMVKHVTTHRSEPRGVSDSLYSPGAKPEPRTVSEAMLTYNSGVIPEPRSVPESFQPGVIVQ